MRVLLVGLWNREEGDSKKTFWQRGRRSSMIHHVLYLFGKKKKGKESNREAKNRYDRNMLFMLFKFFRQMFFLCNLNVILSWTFICIEGFLCGPVVKKLHAMQEMWVQLLGQEDPLEKEVATHFSILPGKSHEQRSLAGYSPQHHKRVRHD